MTACPLSQGIGGLNDLRGLILSLLAIFSAKR